jgi:hypothetical protein
MATSNFLQHDSDKNNIQNDGDFLASATRTGGFVSGQAPSVYFNKLLYQLSTMIAALGQAMANKGYTVADTTLATLTTALENIMTLADMGDYTTNAEMVAYVASQIPVIDFTAVKATNGYQKLPGGLILQWGKYPNDITSETPVSISFPIAFPAACLNFTATAINADSYQSYDMWVQVTSLSALSASVMGAWVGPWNPSSVEKINGFYWFAIGW